MRKNKLLILYHFDLLMASISFIRIWFYLIFLFAILHTIDSFRSYDLRNAIKNVQIEIQNAQSSEEHHEQIRSVLWPKICIAMLKESDDHRLRKGTTKNLLFRSTRKCYPFNIQ